MCIQAASLVSCTNPIVSLIKTQQQLIQIVREYSSGGYDLPYIAVGMGKNVSVRSSA